MTNRLSSPAPAGTGATAGASAAADGPVPPAGVPAAAPAAGPRPVTPESGGPVARLISGCGTTTVLSLSPAERAAVAAGRAGLTAAAAVRPVYGVSRGFGPLAEHPADPDPFAQASGLIDHLTAGQGGFLPPLETRLMIRIRLSGMALGHSGVDPRTWDLLAAQWNAGFIPVVPRDGSLSASGDLIPLAHAARATAGDGQAWAREGTSERRPVSAGQELRRLGLAPVTWEARTALAFVNGTSASLARAMVNHVRLAALARAAAAATGRLAFLLGCDPAPYDDRLAMLRGHPGHRTASAWIRAEAGGGVNPAHGDPEGSPHDGQAGRPFQEPYSLRCAPQILGAVLDQLRSQEEVLAIEATGCTDNPVTFGDDVLHGGNFHAAPVALAVDQQTVCTHQVAFLLERQLALIVDPLRNGGLPPLLARRPGRTSGLAGVQMAASSLLAAIRQHAYPASCTPVPSNLGNQDHVPMALNGANAVAEMLDRAWLIAASVFHALAQVQLLQHRPIADGGLWGDLARHAPDLSRDRPMAAPVAALAARLEAEFTPCRPDLRGEMA